jgi:enoyl-CoA hydratase/carnithine racemase
MVSAKEILLLGKQYNAKEAKKLNIVDDFFPGDELIKKSKDFLLTLPQTPAYHKLRNKLYSKLYSVFGFK